jgi:hypothetical protein
MKIGLKKDQSMPMTELVASDDFAVDQGLIKTADAPWLAAISQGDEKERMHCPCTKRLVSSVAARRAIPGPKGVTVSERV